MRLGIDLVAIEEIEASLRAHGDHYLRRVYSPREVDDCRNGSGGLAAERLAARFAAKEATIKVLRPAADVGVPWQAIEVVRDTGCGVELELSGQAAELAGVAGLGSFSVSLTHEGAYAAAVVLAERDAQGRLAADGG